MGDIPEGFQPHERKSPLTAPWEPIYVKVRDDGVTLGLMAGEPHTNARGLVHGGLISALADNAMGLSCKGKHDEVSGLVTVNLSVDFLGAAQQGQWLEFAASVHKAGRRWISPNALSRRMATCAPAPRRPLKSAAKNQVRMIF